jgi:hypothetical protein
MEDIIQKEMSVWYKDKCYDAILNIKDIIQGAEDGYYDWDDAYSMIFEKNDDMYEEECTMLEEMGV